ncbi:MAG: helix-turn-helix domain-containing protein [Oscillospiraceae bacterium]|nr:helix-turn-helix domain-containing protein [Oscillospiraceae bacterium]
MAIFRVERTHNYTIMSNRHLRDKRLSLKAKGLLSQMLSLPEDWDYTLTGLAKINAEGKDAIRAAIVELESAGYIQRRQTTDKNGKFSGNEYIIREAPTEAPPLASPSSENPATASTATEKTTQLNIDYNKKTKKQNTEFFPFPSGKEAKRTDAREMESYRALIRENIYYDDFIKDHPWDAAQLDEMVELMVEAVYSSRKTIRVAGNDFPQEVVKSRLLNLTGEHIQFVFDCLRKNTTQIRDMKQYLLAVLYNAPATMHNAYAAQVNHDLYGSSA